MTAVVARDGAAPRPGTAGAPAVEPPPEADEGPILVVTADGKGVPMRRPPQEGPKPHHRRTKGEKANKKQMACVGAVPASVEGIFLRL